MPSGGLDKVLRYAAPGRVKSREPILRDGVAVRGGVAEVARGERFVLGHALAVEKQNSVFDFTGETAVAGGFEKPTRRLGRVARHAAPAQVQRAKRVLSVPDFRLRGDPQQLDGSQKVGLRPRCQQKQGEVVACRRLALASGLLQPSLTLAGVLVHAAAINGHQT